VSKTVDAATLADIDLVGSPPRSSQTFR